MPNKDFSGKEKRKFVRADARYVVKYSVQSEDKSIRGVNITQIRNISEAGIMFTSSQYLPEDTLLDLSLRLPIRQAEIEVLGKVVKCQEITKDFLYKVGVEFEDLNAESKKAIVETVNHLLE